MDEFTFQDELLQAPLNLPRAALRLAQEIAYPEMDLYTYLVRLDHMTRSIHRFVDLEAPVHTQADSVADFLFRQLGFSGNASEYNDPRNSYLNEVIDRRMGIPISLSVIFIAIARRLGILAHGIGLPGHFIVGIQDTEKMHLYDPFHGGVRLSEEDCEQLVRNTTSYSGAFQAEWLQPISEDLILTRMLNNLRLIYIQEKDWEHALGVIEHMRLLQPRKHDLLRDMGFVHHQGGSLNKAVQYYEQYLLRAQPSDEEAETITKALRSAAYQLAKLN